MRGADLRDPEAIAARLSLPFRRKGREFAFGKRLGMTVSNGGDDVVRVEVQIPAEDHGRAVTHPPPLDPLHDAIELAARRRVGGRQVGAAEPKAQARHAAAEEVARAVPVLAHPVPGHPSQAVPAVDGVAHDPPDAVGHERGELLAWAESPRPAEGFADALELRWSSVHFATHLARLADRDRAQEALDGLRERYARLEEGFDRPVPLAARAAMEALSAQG